jgi:hypothetical protein
MKSYKVRDGRVLVDGIVYGQTPTEVIIAGKVGRVHSINIGTAKYFPISGQFNDGSIPLVTDNTGLVEETAKPKRTKKVK